LFRRQRNIFNEFQVKQRVDGSGHIGEKDVARLEMDGMGLNVGAQR
jgi:hypothetical protein